MFFHLDKTIASALRNVRRNWMVALSCILLVDRYSFFGDKQDIRPKTKNMSGGKTKMANYEGVTRTNYFKVTDEDAFVQLMERCVTDDIESVDVWNGVR